jgi:hypothetical protein
LKSGSTTASSAISEAPDPGDVKEEPLCHKESGTSYSDSSFHRDGEQWRALGGARSNHDRE